MCKKIAGSIVVLIVIALIACGTIWFYSNRTDKVNMKLQGYSANAKLVKETVNITIQGSIRDKDNETDELDITITFAETYCYNIGKMDPYFISSNQKHGDLPNFFVSEGYAYDRNNNNPTRMVFALDLINNYFIVLFDDKEKSYVVASQNTNAEYAVLVDHFAEFIADYSW